MAQNFSDFLFKISAGQVYGASPFFKFGENPDIDTGTAPEDIISQGGDKLFPSTVSTISIVSTSAQDGVAGTGILTLKILGLDINYNLIEETITTNGLTPVVTTKEFLMVHRMYGLTAGTSKQAVGDLTATHNEGIISLILATHGQTLDCSYTVPTNHLLLLNTFGSSIERTASGAGAHVHFNMCDFNSNVWRNQATASTATSGTSFAQRDAGVWFPVQEKTSIKLTVETVETNNTIVAGFFDGVLLDLTKFRF